MEQQSKSALLVMDMQDGILQNFPGKEALTGQVSRAIGHARKHQVPVIYVVVGFRKGTPELNMNNKGFAAAKSRFQQIDPEQFIQVDQALAPADGEITVLKRRVCAFTGSDLEVVLRAFGIQRLVLTGLATSGVVLSTVREAADKDYQLTVLSDCCGDPDEEVHRVLMTKVFPRQAEVMTLEEWAGA